jgi:tetratricopeptide (TPR) repeat protein
MIRGGQTAVALGAVALLAASAGAQQPAPQGRGGVPGAASPAQPAPTNLQVLPKDISREQLLQTMQAFSQALGVQCSYCHVLEGRGGRNDTASDEKPAKKTARQMLVLAREINDKLPSAVGKPADATTRVGCMTCHRGVAIPRQLTQILSDTSNAKGVEAAVAQYRELRSRYFGSMAYDFSEAGLITVAQAALGADHADSAVTWLNLNLEFYPKSSRTYQVLAQVHQRKNDKDSAIKDLEKAVELDPNNNQARQQLQQLKGA